MRFAQTTLIPNMAAALSSNLDGFDLTREIIRVYVETVAAEPEIYPFVMANNSASKSKVIADSEHIIARMLAVMLRRRMQEAGMDTHGVEPWAYHIVGGVQLATHSWMSHPRMSADELIDYLTMLSWNALCGIVEVGGSLEKFREQPHPSPILPPHCLTRAMTDVIRPAVAVDARATRPPGVPHGRQGGRYQDQRHPGFQRLQERRPDAAGRAQRAVRRTAGDALRQQPRRRHPLGAAGAAGHGHRGQGRHRQTRCRARAIRRASATPASACPPRRSASTTTCGASATRCRRPAISGCSTARTTRTCWWCGCTTWCRPTSGAPATTRSTRSRRNSSTAA